MKKMFAWYNMEEDGDGLPLTLSGHSQIRHFLLLLLQKLFYIYH